MSLIYLASPYSHPHPAIRQARFEAVCLAANRLMKQGWQVFCPIAHSHPIELAGGKIESHEFWMEQDIAILKHCDRLMVFTIAGWHESRGVKQEIELALKLLLPIDYLSESDVEDDILLAPPAKPQFVGNSYKYA